MATKAKEHFTSYEELTAIKNCATLLVIVIIIIEIAITKPYTVVEITL